MKVYEYILKMRDGFSTQFDKLKRAAGTSEGAVGQLNKKMQASSGTVNTLSSSMSGLGQSTGGVSRRIREAKQAGDGLGGTFTNLIRLATTFFGLAAFSSFATSVVSTTARMDGMTAAIKFASGSQVDYGKNQAFLNKLVDDFGLPLEATTSGFKTLSAAMMGSKLQGQATRDIFQGVSTGVVAMGLSGEQAEGAYLALGQMMSKGKVQAEELRGQLGERIPGAFQIAARAMGMTTAQLDKYMASGDLLATNFLPLFAEEMQRTYGKAIPAAAQSLQAQLNRTNNEILRTKMFLGNELRPVITEVVSTFGGLVRGVRENWEVISALGQAVGVGVLVWGSYKTVVLLSAAATSIYTGVTTVARIATVLFARGFASLNMIMSLNPIGLIIAGVAALGAGFVWAYNKVDWFRGGLHALWEIVKFLGDAFAGLGRTIIGAMTFNPAMLNQGLDDLANLDYKGLGQKIKNAYDAGVGASGIELPSILGGGVSAPEAAGAYGDSKTQQGIDNITSGGSKQVSVTINFDKFVENFNINSQTMEEGTEQTYQNFLDMFSRVLNSGTYAISNR